MEIKKLTDAQFKKLSSLETKIWKMYYSLVNPYNSKRFTKLETEWYALGMEFGVLKKGYYELHFRYKNRTYKYSFAAIFM